MTSDASAAARRSAVRAAIIQKSGGYFRNVVREDNVTCRVCAAPVDGWLLCARCNSDRSTFGSRLADVVVPLTYAVSLSQSGYVMRGYKDHSKPEVRASMGRVVSQVLYYALVTHQRCIAAVVGARVDARVAVPSSSALRVEGHPLIAICERMAATSPALRLVPRSASAAGRGTRSCLFTVAGDVKGRHVMVIDDTWTTGGHAQSAALALRDAGASHVSTVVIARWMNHDYSATAEFLRTHRHAAYDPDRCPVTGGDCP